MFTKASHFFYSLQKAILSTKFVPFESIEIYRDTTGCSKQQKDFIFDRKLFKVLKMSINNVAAIGAVSLRMYDVNMVDPQPCC